MDITYGIRIEKLSDPLIDTVQAGAVSFGIIKVPGAFMVDTFPILRHLPSWFPCLTHHKFAAQYRPKVMAMREKGFEISKENFVSVSGNWGTLPPLTRYIRR